MGTKPPERLLGIDYGERRIGVAAAEGTLAVPVAIVEGGRRGAVLRQIADIAGERRTEAIVVGLPLLMGGDEGAQARRTRRFGEALGRLTGLLIIYEDERLTSFRADHDDALEGARASRRSDDLAAAYILQAYIDARGPAGGDARGTSPVSAA